MFGNKKKAELEEELQRLKEELAQSKEIIASLSAQKEPMESTCVKIEESAQQMQNELQQVLHNSETAADYAKQNVEVEAALSHQLVECQQKMKKAEETTQSVKEMLDKQMNSWMEFVELNKHYTDSAKFMNEIPNKIRANSDTYLESLTQMQSFCKQMGVLALNAAIEAGRMGETGKQFVSAAEEVRNYANLYENAIEGLMEQIRSNDENVTNMEEQIHHLVAQMKESNISATHMMKDCSDIQKSAEKNSKWQFSAEVLQMKEQITGVLNVEEEIIKAQERNRIQLSDVQEEYDTQREDAKALIDKIEQVMKSAE